MATISKSGSIDNLVVKTLACSTALKLPTATGTPSPLDFYEVYQLETTLSGAVSVPEIYTITFCRIGKCVTAFFPAMSLQADTSEVIVTGTIPARFIPVSETFSGCIFSAIDDNVAVPVHISFNSITNAFVIAKMTLAPVYAKSVAFDGTHAAGATGFTESVFISYLTDVELPVFFSQI